MYACNGDTQTIQKRVKSVYVGHAIPAVDKKKPTLPPVLLLHGAYFIVADFVVLCRILHTVFVVASALLVHESWSTQAAVGAGNIISFCRGIFVSNNETTELGKRDILQLIVIEKFPPQRNPSLMS